MKRFFKFALLSIFVSLVCTSCDGTLFELLFGKSRIGSNTEVTELKTDYNDYNKYNYFDVSGVPTKGEVKLLVVPLWFNESSTYIISEAHKENVRQDLQKAFFGTSEETGWQSVSSYYKEESLSALNLKGSVTPWIDTEINGKKLTKENIDSLVKEVSKSLFEGENAYDPKEYDSNQDGYLDAVIFIYGLPDYQSFVSTNEYLWAYVSYLQGRNSNPQSPTLNAFMWASYDFMYDEAKAILRSGTTFGGGDTTFTNLDTHTYIHEFGHLLGLDDYYDYSAKYQPAGGFSMQDNNVGGHDPFSVMALGWANPYVPISGCELTLRPFVDSHDLILLSPKFNANYSPFDEYLLLEFYTPTGLNELDAKHQYKGKYPTGLLEAGIRLWHVDARLINIRNQRIYGFYNNPKIGNIMLGMSNSYYDKDDPDSEKRISPLGIEYEEMNLLQLIRNKIAETHKNENYVSNEVLFTNNTAFSMSIFNRQFVNGESLNNGKELGWSFSVKIINEENNLTAKVKLMRE